MQRNKPIKPKINPKQQVREMHSKTAAVARERDHLHQQLIDLRQSLHEAQNDKSAIEVQSLKPKPKPETPDAKPETRNPKGERGNGKAE
jgi:hypothetical protein